MSTREANNRRPPRVRPRDSMRELRKSEIIQSAMSKGTKVESLYQPLTEHEVVQIHQSALNLLEKVGVANPTPRIQDVAISKGCLLNESGRLVFPRSLVEDALDSAAKCFVVHGRKSEFDFELSTETVNFCTGGAAIGQMATFYGIPGGCGAGMTDSKLPDNQAGFEKSMTMLTAALAGGGMVYESAGMLASLLGCSFESMIIDDDMLSCLRRIARGIEVNDETLSLSVIEESVEGPGHFLGQSQTMELMESEYVYPKIANRQNPSDWKQAGALDSWEYASLKAKKILNTYYSQYIDPKLDSVIRSNFQIRLQSN